MAGADEREGQEVVRISITAAGGDLDAQLSVDPGALHDVLQRLAPEGAAAPAPSAPDLPAPAAALDPGAARERRRGPGPAVQRLEPRPLAHDDLATAAAAIPGWWHAIDLGDGVVTPGRKRPELLEAEWARMQLPDLRGKTVLDIGAWDGWFSFTAERLGAKRVVALDHFVWALERDEAAIAGREPHPDAPPEVDARAWDPETLPGRRGFELAHRALDSRVEIIHGDFMTMDLDAIGTFDVVFYLGVLYHMRHPLLALERAAAVCDELVVIETEAAEFPQAPATALAEFFPTTELNGDASNWWSPNGQALEGLCRAAGFRDVRTIGREPWPPQPGADVHRYRAHVHARR